AAGHFEERELEEKINQYFGALGGGGKNTKKAVAEKQEKPAALVFEPDLGPGGDLDLRSAPWPGSLDGATGRVEVTLALDPPRTLFADLPRPPEFRWPRRFWSPTAEAPDGTTRGTPRSDPRALPALLVAIASLALAAFLAQPRCFLPRRDAEKA
ncbi:MAG: hypothetical protein HZA53_08745, partial [Planctomycetes bacterium]|nr:hypothetical protein [Planctomycetota bacterium]